MSQLFTSLKRFYTAIFKQNQFKIQTFTYFIPAPRPRKTGYREKQFDKLFYQFINLGYKILDFKTQQCMSGQDTSGIWVIFVLQAKNARAEKLDLESFGLINTSHENEKVISHTDSEANLSHFDSQEEKSIELPELSEELSEGVKGLYQIKEK
jgi:hypothetical protein